MSEISELKDAIESKGRAWEELKATVNTLQDEVKKGKSDPTLDEKIEKINAALTKSDAEKTALEAKIEALETKVARSEFQGGGATQIDKVKAEHKAAFEKWFRRGGEAQEALVKNLQIQAGLSTLSDPDGGYVVTPPEYDTAIDRVAMTMSAMRRLATVRTIGTDTYKKLVNQGGAASGWVAEKATRTETDTPVLREIAINTKEIYAMPGCTQVSLDDAQIDLASWLADEVSIEFTEEEGSAFISGNGVEKPHGIAGYTMIADASYAWGKVGFIISGHATLINNADKLMDVTLALKPMYLNGASWLMNRATTGKIRQLKDGEGNYVWRPGLEAGAPNTLFSYPVELDDNVDNIGAGKYPCFFANFKRAYLILDRMGIRILRDPYTSKGNVLFYTTRRVGGGLVSFESVKCLKVSA
jgi:HK97 family phage major capsid protein